MKSIPRWVQIVLGIAIVLVFLAIGAVIVGVSYMREHFNVVDSSEQDAGLAFDEVRAKFPGQLPLFELRDGKPHYVEERATAPSSNASITTLHVIAWDSDDRRLARFDIPWWMMRLKSGTISFSSYASGLDEAGVKLSPRDIERHGPGILLDFTERREGRVLVWAE